MTEVEIALVSATNAAKCNDGATSDLSVANAMRALDTITRFRGRIQLTDAEKAPVDRGIATIQNQLRNVSDLSGVVNHEDDAGEI